MTYGKYAFDILLDVHAAMGVASANRTWSSALLAQYFSNTFSSTTPNRGAGINGWSAILWDVRTACGQTFTDRALIYFVGSPEPQSEASDPQMKHFNKYFWRRLVSGAEVVDSAEWHGLKCIDEIMNVRGMDIK
jgi:hypothetical protein